jgi:hypothetical protein
MTEGWHTGSQDGTEKHCKSGCEVGILAEISAVFRFGEVPASSTKKIAQSDIVSMQVKFASFGGTPSRPKTDPVDSPEDRTAADERLPVQDLQLLNRLGRF